MTNKERIALEPNQANLVNLVNLTEYTKGPFLKKESYEEYANNPAINQSLLAKLEYSVPAFYKEYTGNVDVSAENLYQSLGSVIHCLLLEPEEFTNKYVVLPAGPGGMMEIFIREYAARQQLYSEITPAVERTIAQDAYLASGYKWSIEKVLEKFRTAEAQSFYELLLLAKGKTVIDRELLDTATKCVSSIQKHKAWQGFENMSESYVEISMYARETLDLCTDVDEHACLRDFWYKGRADKIIINYNQKTVVLIDVKSTSKGSHTEFRKFDISSQPSTHISGFLQSFINYKYYRQLAFYNWLLNKIFPDFTITTYVVAVDTKRYDTRVYRINKQWIRTGLTEVERLRSELIQHEQYGTWEYDNSYYNTDGIIEL